jgi:hypothetical protein
MLNHYDLEQIENQIKKLFHRNLEADQHAINMTLLCNNGKMTDSLLAQKNYIDLLENGRKVLSSVLSENERIVLEYHFVMGLDWDCVSAEFTKRWGDHAVKSKRCLIYYLNRAFKKMAEFVICNSDIYDFSWLMNI